MSGNWKLTWELRCWKLNTHLLSYTYIILNLKNCEYECTNTSNWVCKQIHASLWLLKEMSKIESIIIWQLYLFKMLKIYLYIYWHLEGRNISKCQNWKEDKFIFFIIFSFHKAYNFRIDKIKTLLWKQKFYKFTSYKIKRHFICLLH